MKIFYHYHSCIITLLTIGRINADDIFTDCAPDDFYELLSGNLADRSAMHDLLRSKHRRSLPYTSGKDDVWDALIDLDGNPSQNKISLIYSSTTMDINPYGTPETWNREHIWPRSRGLFTSGIDNVDVRNLLPCDWGVNSARGNKYFAECGIFNDVSQCDSPAHPDAALDTKTDGDAWLPPANKRGDLARILFYMEVRYEGGENGVENLVLSDQPQNFEFGMGHLSSLLAWNTEDPVDDAERARNDRICQKWQGNRNPFVDYPDLANVYYSGAPPTPPMEPSPQPSSRPPPTAGTCKGNLSAGDIMLTGVSSNNPDIVVMVAMKNIPVGSEIFMTDNAWTGDKFKTNEGIQKLILSASISSGTIFGFGDSRLQFSNLWKSESGVFALSTRGDNIFLYCVAEETGTKVPITGLIYNRDGWTSNANGSFSSSGSALPSLLTQASSLELPSKKSLIYNGQRTGTREYLLENLSSESNWLGSNSGFFNVVDMLKFNVLM